MISIIIPNYNRTNELVKAVKHALDQTYKDIEIIIIDDNSSIDTQKFLFDKLEHNEKIKIKFVKNDKNIGAAASRNKGVDIANGKFIAFLDSDDYWDNKKLEKQLEKFEKNEKLDLVYCDQFIDREGRLFNFKKKLIKDDFLNNLISGWTAPNTSTLIYKKESFKKINGFDETLKSCQDHDLWFRMAKEEFKIDYIDEPLSYFVQDSSDRISYDLDNRMDGVNRFLEKCQYYMSENEYKNFRKEYIFKTSLPIFVKTLKKGQLLKAIEIYIKYLFNNKYFYEKIMNKLGLKK